MLYKVKAMSDSAIAPEAEFFIVVAEDEDEAIAKVYTKYSMFTYFGAARLSRGDIYLITQDVFDDMELTDDGRSVSGIWE